VNTPLTINQKKLTAYLCKSTQFHEETFYSGFNFLPTGHEISFSKNTFTLTQNWSAKDILTPEIKLNALEDYKDFFMETFEKAVKVRLRSEYDVAADLSAGLDSSTVSAFTAKELGKRKKKLHCFTSYPDQRIPFSEGQNQRFNELEIASCLPRDFKNILHHQIGQSQCNTGFVDTFLGTTPHIPLLPICIMNMSWLIEFEKIMSEKNIRTRLTGGSGNFTISRRTRKMYPHYLNPLRQAKRYFRNKFSGTPVNDVVSKQTRKKYGVTLPKSDRYSFWTLKDLVENYQDQMQYSIPFYQYLYTKYGVSIADPTIDLNVIKMSLSLHEALEAGQKHVGEKPIRTLLKDFLPAEIIDNKKIGQQNMSWPNIFDGLNKEALKINPDILSLFKGPIQDTITIAWNSTSTDNRFEDYRTYERLLLLLFLQD